MGEPPLMLCLSVWIAVKHALSSISNGVIPQLNLPATAEEILRILTELEKNSKNRKENKSIPNESEVSLVFNSLITPEKKQVAWIKFFPYFTVLLIVDWYDICPYFLQIVNKNYYPIMAPW